MDFQPLLAPIPGDAPEGLSCQDERRFREMKPLVAFLTEQAKARELERQLREPFKGDAAAAEKMLKEALKVLQTDLKERIVPAASEVLDGIEATVPSVVEGIRHRAVALLRGHGKDLAVVVRLALAETASRGVAGLADALELFEALVNQHGPRLHPLPDEDGDTFERNRLLSELLAGEGLLALLRQSVVAAAEHRRLTLRDFEGREGLMIPKDQKDALSGLNNDLELLEAFAGAVALNQGIRREEVSAQDQWAMIEAQIGILGQLVSRLQSLARQFRVPLGTNAQAYRLLDRALKVLQAARLLLPLSQVSLVGVGGLAPALACVESLLAAEGDAMDRNRPLHELLAGERLQQLLGKSAVFPRSVARVTWGDVASATQPLAQDGPAAGLRPEQYLLAELAAMLAAEQQIDTGDVRVDDQLAQLDARIAPSVAALEGLRALARAYRVSVDASPVLALIERGLGCLQQARRALAPPLPPPDLGASREGAGAGREAEAVVVPGHAPAANLAATGVLRTREDARLAILTIATFLEHTEPAHPSALFLHRAAKLLQARSFFDIVQELLPGSPVDTISTLTGAKPPEP